MLIVIDLSAANVSPREPDEFTRFSVALEGEGDLARVVQQAASTRLGRLGADGAHVVVDPVAPWALAGPAADEGFPGMCVYAAGKSWVEPDGGVLAHVEPGPGRG